MIDKRESLTIYKQISSVFTDISENLADYLNDTETVTLAIGDYIYVGYYKAINSMYVELETPNLNQSKLNVEIYDGTSWITPDYRDETKGLQRNGFITFDKNSSELTIVEGKELAWVRLSVDVDTSSVTIKGINIVFTDKSTIKQEFFEIDKVVSDVDLVAKLVASRNEIMERLSQRGYLKQDKDITAFDLHDVYQIKQASTYLTLAKIFLVSSDSTEDHWWSKYEIYHKKYERSINLYKIDIDENDNGKNDEDISVKKFKTIRWSR
jgi:hypothetical protein